MKLIVFVNGDAPQQCGNCKIASNEILMSYVTNQVSKNKLWKLEALENCNTADADTVDTTVYSNKGEIDSKHKIEGNKEKVYDANSHSEFSTSAQCHYWILDDNNNFLEAIQTPVFAIPINCNYKEINNINTTSSSNLHSLPSYLFPKGVTDADICNVDFRSKLGQQLEKVRHEYGATYKTAAKSARQLMNAEELQEKKQDKMKRERESVIEALEAGQEITQSSTKQSQRSGTQKQQRKRVKKE